MYEEEENNKSEVSNTENEAKERMGNEKYQKDRAQVFNPVTKRWVKFDTKHGGIVQHKNSPGPFDNVKKYRKKRR